MDKQVLDKYIETLQSKYDAYYTGYSMHPEEGKNIKINEQLLNIKKDLEQIDDGLIQAGDHVDALMTNTILRLNNIQKQIMTERERFQDMQMLCNRYTDYDNVMVLTDKDFEGNFSYINETFVPKINSSKKTSLNVLQVYGNGYEGNKYVYNNYEYDQEIMDTSQHIHMVDGKLSSYYEYSRITMNNIEELAIPDFNKDNKEAQCTITYVAEEPINQIEIHSDNTDIIITNVAYSKDNVEYVNLDIPYITINNKITSYESYGYVYGSGIISFPTSVQTFKITYQSNGYKDDVLAYEKVLSSMVYDESSIPEIDYSTTIVKSAKRHVIKINDVYGYKYKYTNKIKMQTYNLINYETYAISVFANVYIPQGLDDSAVKFYLTVNGVDYEVAPINSHLNKTKVIRFSTGNNNSQYVTRIGEVIKSAYLTIVMTGKQDLAPAINNIKILIGGEL